MPIHSTLPIWDDAPLDAAPRPSLQANAFYDVAVIGGGITGLTAAWLLKKAGKRVALIDSQRVADGDTAHTSGHLSLLLDERYHSLAKGFGKGGARLAADASRFGIDFIESLLKEERVDAQFRRVPGFLLAEDEGEVEELRRELPAAQDAGLAAELVDAAQVPYPGPVLRALRVENQADFHPRRYLRALADRVHGEGCAIFESTRALQVKDGSPCEVVTPHAKLMASHVIVATNSAINNLFFLQTKVAAYRTYALAARTSRPLPPGHYYDLKDPYHYVRTYDSAQGTLAIIGGEDHKVGAGEPAAAFAKLESYARGRLGISGVVAQWSGQVLEPVDGLPFIGRNSVNRNVFIALGYSGTGLTFGTVAAHVVADLILGRPNRFAELFKATRFKPLASASEYVSENVDFPLHLMLDRLVKEDAHSVDEVRPGEGKIIASRGKKIADFRDKAGVLTACSATCTHMGCVVHWNAAESSWDCPCHGGRFDPAGKVLNGPPTKDLSPEKIP